MKILKWLDDNIEKAMIFIVTTVMLIALFLQVLFRFLSFLNFSVAWVEEIAIFGLLWLSYFGASLATKNRANLKVEILTTFLSPKLQIVFSFISHAFLGAFCLFVTYYSTFYCMNIFQKGQTSAVLQIPKWTVYCMVPIAFLLQIIRIIQDCIKLSKELKESGTTAAAISENQN